MAFTLVLSLTLWIVVPTSATISYTCRNHASSGDWTVDRNAWHIRGTNLGGWLVLEPWITPSLFYQFLGAEEKWGNEAPKHVAFDSFSFCSVLGKEEANKQLRRHWSAWVTEDNIREIAGSGIDTLRVPVGDWMFIPYEPYIGCFDGAIDELNRIISLADKYHLNILLDIHAMKGGQNFFDNSGSSVIEWTSSSNFSHILSAGWMGPYDQINRNITVVPANIERSLDVIRAISNMYKDTVNIIGLEALNEPLYETPIEALKQFYWDTYNIVQAANPSWLTVFHDSFRLSTSVWGDFMVNCSNYALDSHMYLAWSEPTTLWQYTSSACNRVFDIISLESIGVPVIVGEWSLATDNCAMWLQGFNNNIYGFPKKQCAMVTCADPYMGSDQPGAPPDPSLGIQGPFGSGGTSTPINGKCPSDVSLDDENFSNDRAMTILANAQLQVFERSHGQFFWNFRTELEPRWSYIESVRRGWLPNTWNEVTQSSLNICLESGGLEVGSLLGPSPASYLASTTFHHALAFCAFMLLTVAVSRVWLNKRDTSRNYVQLPLHSELPLQGIAMQEMRSQPKESQLGYQA